ncbi:myb-like protein AA [Drosophila albomicans]|uniref:Myb-like protein AA n=1 Tax=Drosophila albomicans TaxID=7291 RepID=A0A6P8W8S6_DROAB|nr:myb-like protein AA [Drosophila albomicans]
MDYDNLSFNLGDGSQATDLIEGVTNSKPTADPEAPDANMCGSQELLEVKSKEKARRYWTPSEEERLYEIWGRDNWRLTRNGKNTIFFGQWSEELRERFSVDVKPEEIQMKVNQTRAKFRQVKKQLQSDPSSYSLRWKKYDIINRILKNIHRPKNAEPIPPDVLLNNRDVSPPREEEQQQKQQPQQQQQGQSVLNLTTEPTGNNFYNNSSNSNNSNSHAQVNNNNNNTMSFNTELFTDQYDDIKREYDEDDYRSMPFQEQLQQYSPAEPAQLLELQTPQQQQQQQQQQHFQSEYESSVVNYAASGISTQQQQPQQYNSNSTSSSNNAASVSSINHQAITAVAYINSSNNTISVATNNSNSKDESMAAVQMQPPVGVGAASNAISTTPRKRGRPFGSSNPPAADSLESIYIEEVRRKNQLLSEQTKISRQRLELEERKVELMQTFFPKCLEQQAHILARVMQLPSLQQHLQSPSLPPPQQ